MRGTLRSLTLALCLAGTACQAGAPPPTPQTAENAAAKATGRESDPDALPKALDRLSLSLQQQAQVRALIAEVKRDIAPATAKRDDFRHAMVSAARGCSADDSRLHIEAGRMVEAGEKARPRVLDAINEFHAILTPKQRAELVDPVLSGDTAIGEDTSDGREKGLGKIAEALDLSFTQKIELIKRAMDRLSISTETTATLRAQAVTAVSAFKRDDFDIRDHAIAEAPLVKLYTRLVLDLAQVVLPVLSREQCDTAASLLHDMFEKPRVSDPTAGKPRTAKKQ